MSAAARAVSLLWLGLTLASCDKAAQDEAAGNISAATEVEALPADESAATPTDELANGATEPENADAPQIQ